VNAVTQSQQIDSLTKSMFASGSAGVLRAVDYAPIVVVIPSFRCSHLVDTILQLYQLARHPLRVHLSVLEHTADAQGSVADTIRQRLEALGLYIWASNVTWALQPQAWGAAHARAMACQNYKAYKYALHIHAHTQAQPHWDAHLIEDYEGLLLRHGRARDVLLTTHPDEMTWHYLRFQSHLHAGYGLPVTEAAPCHGPGNKRVSLTTAIWCDKFSFGHASIHDAVPFDAGLRVITDCVDLVYSARLHAAGVLLLHPPHTYMTHQGSHGCATYWQCTPSSASLRAAEQVSQRRLKCQLGLLRARAIQPEMKGLPPVLEPHHLEAYGQFAGINFGGGTVQPSGAWGLTSHSTAKEYFIKTGLV
jgi:hypothetical protein